MAREDENLSITLYKPFNFPQTTWPVHQKPNSGQLEIRLFYVRISPCAVHTLPENLTLRHLRIDPAVSLEINGLRVSSQNSSVVKLKRHRIDQNSTEVTYVSTDSIRVTGSIEFEVIEDENVVILCGSLGRIEGNNGLKCGWKMGFKGANCSKFEGFSMSIEVYIAGCCGGEPVMLTKTVELSPKRPNSRVLDVVPEGLGRENGGVWERKLKATWNEADGYESDRGLGPSYYSEEMYYGEDGQLTWFNAGVRVGIGIGLGVCLGVGIGVRLLMRSYQATTWNFRRRFF